MPLMCAGSTLDRGCDLARDWRRPVDRHDIGLVVAQLLDPDGEAGLNRSVSGA
jgi:hypothetical protein